jgi:hypothetical protein
MQRLLAIGLMVTATLLSACAISTLQPAVPLPEQSLDTSPGPGTTRVVLFNDSDRVLYGLDGSGKINASLDGKGLASVKIGQYLRLDLAPDEYILTLEHRDIVVFKSTHVPRVDQEPVFVKFGCTPTSHSVRVLQNRPADFENYEPAIAR